MQLHSDAIAPVILGTTGILFFAVIGRFAARRLGQPSVLGELVMGIVLGTFGYMFSIDFLEILREGTVVFDIVGQMLAGDTMAQAAKESLNGDYQHLIEILGGPEGQAYLKVAQTVDVFSRYGVIFMLFLVGLETSLGDLKQVGRDSTVVSVIGVIAPFTLGIVVTRMLLPEISLQADLFIAATLVATSIGITARVLTDLQRQKTPSARVILGAAVIDDVLGLILLAVVTGIIVSGQVAFGEIGFIIAMSTLFFVVAFIFGPYFLKGTIALVRRLDIVEAKMFISFLFVMMLAWVANLIGLATIIGAFTAGVILHDGYFHHWGDVKDHRLCIRDLIAPLETILVPIFFVLMGIQVKLEAFLDMHVALIAVLLTAVAIVGKLVSGIGASRDKNRLAIGLGMMPRGEVGLIFASLGKSLGVLSDSLFSSIVIMIVVTTVITPPLLKYALLRREEEDVDTNHDGAGADSESKRGCA